MINLGILVAGHIDLPHVRKYKGYADMFEQLFSRVNGPFKYHIYNIVDGEFPEFVHDCDAWLITGSASGVYDDTHWMQWLKGFIQRSDNVHKPMVGICFGHQIIAEALGGKVVKSSKGWGLGPQTYFLNNSQDHTKKAFTINAIHQDQVIDIPPQARHLAHSEFCLYAALGYGNHILTFQGHPEFTCEYERDLLLFHKGKAIDTDSADIALQNISSKIDQEWVAQELVNCLLGKGIGFD